MQRASRQTEQLAVAARRTTDNWVERRALMSPTAPALVGDGVMLTFADLRDQAKLRARRLLGVMGRPGRVALLCSNSVEYAVWLAAALAIGAQAVPLNARLSVPELLAQACDCTPDLFVTDAGHRATAVRVWDEYLGHMADGRAGANTFGRRPYPRPLLLDDTDRAPLCDEAVLASFWLDEFDLDEVADVMYTSGSTGIPKGVLQTYGNHWHSAVNCRLNLGFTATDIWGCPTPLFHTSGLSILMRCLVHGVAMRVYDRFDAAVVNDDALAGRITCLSAVTYQLERMLEDLDARAGEARYPVSLRFVLQGGGPLPLETLDACARRGLRVAQSFGMTETASQVVSLSPEDAASKPGSSGRPLASVRLRIADADGPSDAALPAGCSGRILLKSPTLACGYLNQPERFAASFTLNGWFDTADLGHVDEDGYLYVECRRTDLIISGGENIYPAEVERAVLRHPLVKEACVVGVPDPVWGSIPVAVCVPVGSLEPDDPELPDDTALRDFCRHLLAPYKCPRRVVWTGSLPLTASGKPRRPLIADLALAGTSSRGAAR